MKKLTFLFIIFFILISYSQSNEENKLNFITPKKKGAYRFFAYIKNDKGQSSVANIPFLIE